MKKTSLITRFSLKNNRKLKVFLFFLILSSIFWLLIQLSKSYVSTATFNAHYKNIPIDMLLQQEPTTELNLAIKAPGFTLLKYKAKTHKIDLSLNGVVKNKNAFYLLPKAQLAYLNEQISGETEVIGVLQDTVFIKLGNTITKKVPVNSNLEIKFKLGYNFIENLIVTPDSVVISGPETSLDTISEIQTVTIKLNDVYETVNVDLKLVVPNEDEFLVLSEKTVNAVGEVDKFTEGVFTMPVVIINEPEGVTINPFPKEVKVSYQVGLSNFNKINKNSFTIVFDYNQYKNDTLTRYLSPVIPQKSEFIHSLKINPSQIEFLIQK